ncbi:hypothetical protein FHU10_2808 [Serratia fonticola]|jgi:hypothetical protein|uniref:Uncharacterized protein n=1 Tax=Serratia fonticola TaxID=47917 RepID=A0A542BUI1_SERFO|nr:hypothetical protein FHU09_4901 [Serratia fonticola]TQI95755.1 hypothetical protein FHU11_1149 [Serratia fonticola]TVZ70250.1 hypothetical protein FHU10_2808 [Serratia fonticola]
MSGILLSREDLMLLSPSTRAEILALVSGEFHSGFYKKWMMSLKNSHRFRLKI